jgi:hypothetical protein
MAKQSKELPIKRVRNLFAVRAVLCLLFFSVSFPGIHTGHWVLEENPMETTEALVKFL